MVATKHREWLLRVPQLLPGGHVAVFTPEVADAFRGRMAGLELRDTLLVILGSQRSSFVFLFRAPLSQPTITEQVIATGTGGLNIEACRILYENGRRRPGERSIANRQTADGSQGQLPHHKTWGAWTSNKVGRYPPNVILVHDDACKGLECSVVCPVYMINQGTHAVAVGDEPIAPSDYFTIFRNRTELLGWLERLVVPEWRSSG
jgi:hypothetical protein